MWVPLALCCSAALCSSTPDVAIEGLVVDPSGAVVSGARVVIAGTGSTTDQEGKFSLKLPPGDYTVRVAAGGFIESLRQVAVAPGRVSSVVIELQLGPRSDVITVTESPGYQVLTAASATKTATPLINVPQAISIVNSDLIKDQLLMSVGDAMRYVPGVTAIQGENNRDQLVIRGNSSSADFFVNGVRDDVQYYRDLYNVEQLEALKGPNAMIFGRGGGGGVVNRVTKEAGSAPLREFDLQGGSFGRKRLATDWDQPLGRAAAIRLNGMYEAARSFRDGVDLERYGINPTASLTPSQRTRIVLSYERFHDGRTADRGVPSYMGRPVDVPISTFYGNSSDSWVRADVNVGSARIERQFSRINLRNSTSVGDFDRGYQNYVAGAVTAGRSLVALSAYNNATRRRNMFNQTDLTYTAATGAIRHTLLWGAELSRQNSDNFRNTGYFNNASTSFTAPYASPSVNTPVIFRQSATDADNHVRADVAAGYVQDHIEFSRFLQVLLGARVDRFNLEFHNNRTGEDLQRIDHLISPRAGLVIKPAAGVSVYGSYSVSWLPSSGDQFSSLTAVTQQVKPEKFTNYETGVKWDLLRDLSLTAAAYRLDRTNTRSMDPNDPTRIIQTGSQRSKGVEIGLTGRLTRKWQVAGGYAFQDVRITGDTLVAKTGARVAQTPRHALSLWNRYQLSPRLSLGLGILTRADMFAGIDNTVVLPGYARADAAAFYSLTERIRIQANVENIFNRKYFVNADGNNNISPGGPRAIRLGLIARF